MSMKDDQIRLVYLLKDSLLESYDLDALILFGSLGRGDGDEFSDVDLLVVMESDRDSNELSNEMIGRLAHLTKDIHILVRTPHDFFRQCDIPGTLVYAADREGRILFDSKEWRRQKTALKSYETRKMEVIKEEYMGQANDYLARARSSLHKGNLFRCRDYARFAALKAIKSIFVKHDTHPPRKTDLVELIGDAKDFEPGIEGHIEFITKLNSLCPGNAYSAEAERMKAVLDKTSLFIDEIIKGHEPNLGDSF